MLEPESGVFRCLNASVEGVAGRNPDGSIDYGHMRLSSREKAEKAAMQHWELLEVSRLGRRGADGVPRTGTAERRRFVPPAPPDKISPVR